MSETQRDNIDKLYIRLNLYDKSISVRIKRDEEETYRKAEKLINDTFNDYSNLYKTNRGQEDISRMVMLHIARSFIEASNRNDVAPFNDILSHLTSEIEEVLS